MTTLPQQILESSVKELHQLKDRHEGTLAAVVIDQEIRLRQQMDTLNKLNREHIDRTEVCG
ncbi:MAG: hypothetical protein K2X09_07505 [Rickettsiales bacterium]|nr:hypothetical protein [Rickettsiales bacterium]